jgi:hypothetical protein
VQANGIQQQSRKMARSTAGDSISMINSASATKTDLSNCIIKNNNNSPTKLKFNSKDTEALQISCGEYHTMALFALPPV